MVRDRFGQESALIVPVPDAETVVGPWRESLDPACEWGVPAHITVLYPFVPPDEIDSEIQGRLQDVLARVPAFDFRLASVEWFADDVAWARPEPAGPFRDLTARVSEAWPAFPPYEGAFDEVIPHLTICQGADPRHMAVAAAAVAERLPIHARADRVRLMAGRFEADSWTTLAEFRLANG
ncbi:MAG TPA: 2'-5' RNA ligase family protein [Acidimicrobiia bacterium]|nr:2'-5' RNA ligase family protein [Acidimicrobiia bacterium]